MRVYDDYQADRVGWFFGLRGPQLTLLAVACLPVFMAISATRWLAALGLAVCWGALLVLVAVPVRGRSATGWAVSAAASIIGAALGWTVFRSQAASGHVTDPLEPDLPGALQAISVHEGPTDGHAFKRIALIQNHAARTWALTAAVVHPGIGMSEPDQRARLGAAEAELIDLANRTELIDELILLVRTVPEDGAERDQWVTRRRVASGPDLARQVNDDLRAGLARASVRTEAFFTFVVREKRISGLAKEVGRGLEGRARVLYSVARELEAHLRGSLEMSQVSWLTSPELAAACRTGFAPSDRAGIVDALSAQARDPGVNADVPWSLAGPSGADPVMRHYSHDAWNSVSAAIVLPAKGALMGALAPVLTPEQPGERRCFMVSYPIVGQAKADRASQNSEFAADTAESLRQRLGIKQRARSRDQGAKARAMDGKLARGNSMIRPYAIATVTVPKTARVSQYARGLDSSIRRAGFAPLRLDIAHEVGFAASVIPMGLSLTRTSAQ